jgi:hypothetical protein
MVQDQVCKLAIISYSCKWQLSFSNKTFFV